MIRRDQRGRLLLMASTFIALGLGAAGVTLPVAAAVLPSCLHDAGPDAAAEASARFKTLDVMDFDIFSNHLWDRIDETQSTDIFYQMPDGSTTNGLSAHLGIMQFVTSFIPDARITGHPVCIASGDWTAMIGTFEGTFSKPMANAAGGPPMPPTGKSFRTEMATLSRWRGPVMDHVLLFWDNADLGKQMGYIPGPATPKGDPGPYPPSGTDAGVSPGEVTRRLAVLDDMDFVVWSKQQWDRIPESHAADVVVVLPDGRVIKGLPDHLRDMKALFVWAPDARITKHPVKFGQGEWTVLVGEMQGTFSQPMPNPAGGSPIAPTGKPFDVQMTTFSHWNGEGKMDREDPFWDNQAWMKQIGLAQ